MKFVYVEVIGCGAAGTGAYYSWLVCCDVDGGICDPGLLDLFLLIDWAKMLGFKFEAETWSKVPMTLAIDTADFWSFELAALSEAEIMSDALIGFP